MIKCCCDYCGKQCFWAVPYTITIDPYEQGIPDGPCIGDVRRGCA